MNRRDFIKGSVKLLIEIPALGWLKPEEIEGSNTFSGLDVPSIDDPLTTALAPTVTQQLVKWNGAGDSWETIDSEETWVHTNSGFSFGPDNMIYVGGAFVNPSLVTNDEYWASWNGQEFERLDTIECDLVTQGDLLE